MSLHKILISAQKLGMPVIITDRQGEQAQVVMPFDDFLALTHAASGEGRSEAVSPRLSDDFEDAFGLESASHEPAQQMDFSVGELDEEIQAEMNRAASIGSSVAGMEEKFYLEPLGEEEDR